MTTQLSYSEVAQLQEALRRSLPVKISANEGMWDMAHNRRVVKSAFQDFDEMRVQLVLSHDKNGDQNITPTDTEWKEFSMAFSTLLAKKVSLELRPLKLSSAKLEELDAALNAPATPVAADADAEAKAKALALDAANVVADAEFKAIFSLLIQAA